MELSKHSVRYIIGFVLFAALCFMFFITCTNPTGASNKILAVTLTFQGPRYQGNFYSGYLPSTDWAVWIENSNHQYIRTLQINKGVVKIGEHGAHADHLPAWLACTGDSINDTPDADSIPDRFDGITAASYLFDSSNPSETVTATWDFTDASGNTVVEDTYYFCAEVANIQKDSANNPVGYTFSVLSENTAGTVTYPSGATVDGTPSANILSCTGTID